jgi:hypothetical protein
MMSLILWPQKAQKAQKLARSTCLRKPYRPFALSVLFVANLSAMPESE